MPGSASPWHLLVLAVSVEGARTVDIAVTVDIAFTLAFAREIDVPAIIALRHIVREPIHFEY